MYYKGNYMGNETLLKVQVIHCHLQMKMLHHILNFEYSF